MVHDLKIGAGDGIRDGLAQLFNDNNDEVENPERSRGLKFQRFSWKC